MQGTVAPQTFHDLGNLMFAFNMFWAYVCFSQLLIIWSANLPEEIYLLQAAAGEWLGVCRAVLFLFHFAIPFLILLLRKNKRQPQVLVKIAMWMMLMRFVDLYWQMQPAFAHEGGAGGHVSFHWLNVASLVAIGGIWVWFFMMQLKKRSLEQLPVNYPVN